MFTAAIALILVLALIIFILYRRIMWPKSTVFGYYPWGIKTDKKIIALTFDDGPSDPYTKDLLNILAKNNVSATFFLVGKNVEKNPNLAKSIIDAGHIIGNHAYSHNLFKYLSSPSLKDEITKTQEIIYQATGKKPALFRSPWLIRHSGLFKVMKTNNLTPISGLFGTEKEVWQVSAEIIYKDALKQIAPGVILIFHDGFTKNGDRSGTIKAMELLIPELKSQGYELVTIDKLLNIPAYQ